MRNISKHFSGGGTLLNSIMDIHSIKADGGADQNLIAVDVSWAVKVFYFAEIINEWPLNGKKPV